MNAQIVVMINYNEIEYDEEGVELSKTPKTIFLESVEDVDVEESSELTTHPVVSGDLVADHMIKQPDSMTINGDMSINGSENVIIDGTKPSLKSCQETFKKIKNNAYLCTITKLVLNTNEVRFLQRENMVLTSISWVERVSSLGFTFSFKQALLSSVQEYDIDTMDANLPAITEPVTMSFTSQLLDWQQVDAIVIDTCSGIGLITDSFMTFLKSYGAAYAVGAALTGAAVLATYFAACAAIPVGGWVVGAVSAAIIGVAIIGWGLVSAIKSAYNSAKYRVQQFKAYQDDRKNQQEVERFANFMNDIHKQLESLNDMFYVYQISSNEPQECMLSIADEYYTFTFTKNNVTNKWVVTVTMPSQNDKSVAADKSADCAKHTFAECKSDNALFRAEISGAYVYLIYIRNEDYDEDDLRNYYILVSGIKPEQFNDAITEIIKNAVLY